ncbi:MAG: hypothetical protein HOH48_06960 [Candidatus Puniceispirillum sp.]|jgi:3-(methylthio)propanoyl-CoA dehydrogenase|nr:hypothetical protein [Candidatus Puniceispirillum sp.]MBT6565925.1 hypothetical protein [Candidatus Puniceispirillum sp.]
MKDFAYICEDILFSLRHIALADRLVDWDNDAAKAIISHFGAFAEEVLLPTNVIDDSMGAKLENGRVILPDALKTAYHHCTP